MMRSLWTAASGMTAQQLNVDTISNNISNVNTTAFKKDRMEFKDLMYQTLDRASLDQSDNKEPVNLQVGLGVRPIASTKTFTMGSFQQTQNNLDFGLNGEGFFMVDRGNGDIAYTRDGSFKISVNEGGEINLVTSQGYYILDSQGEIITLPANTQISKVNIDENGAISYSQNDETITVDNPIGIVQFGNPQALESVGGNLYVKSIASGEPVNENDGEITNKTKILQGFLEASNVNVAEEMVNLIVTQRAYELSSKAITTSDDMLSQAINIKQ